MAILGLLPTGSACVMLEGSDSGTDELSDRFVGVELVPGVTSIQGLATQIVGAGWTENGVPSLLLLPLARNWTVEPGWMGGPHAPCLAVADYDQIAVVHAVPAAGGLYTVQYSATAGTLWTGARVGTVTRQPCDLATGVMASGASYTMYVLDVGGVWQLRRVTREPGRSNDEVLVSSLEPINLVRGFHGRSGAQVVLAVNGSTIRIGAPDQPWNAWTIVQPPGFVSSLDAISSDLMAVATVSDCGNDISIYDGNWRRIGACLPVDTRVRLSTWGTGWAVVAASSSACKGVLVLQTSTQSSFPVEWCEAAIAESRELHIVAAPRDGPSIGCWLDLTLPLPELPNSSPPNSADQETNTVDAGSILLLLILATAGRLYRGPGNRGRR